MMYLSLVSDIAAIFLLWLFARAGLHKLLPDSQGYFITLLREYGINNQPLSVFLRYGLGLLEISLAVLVVFPATRSVAVVGCIIVLLVYLAAMAYQLYQGKKDISCGCAGPNAKLKVSGALLWRNGILATFALSCFAPSYGFSESVWLVTTMSSLFVIVFYSSIEHLIENEQLIQLLRNK